MDGESHERQERHEEDQLLARGERAHEPLPHGREEPAPVPGRRETELRERAPTCRPFGAFGDDDAGAPEPPYQTASTRPKTPWATCGPWCPSASVHLRVVPEQRAAHALLRRPRAGLTCPYLAIRSGCSSTVSLTGRLLGPEGWRAWTIVPLEGAAWKSRFPGKGAAWGGHGSRPRKRITTE